MLILSTGQAAATLGVSEPRLNDLIRRRKLAIVPPIVAGRRVWGVDHLRAAAEAFGLGAAKIETVVSAARR